MLPHLAAAVCVWFEVASGHKCWFLPFRRENLRAGSISAVPLHINSISSYVLKTWWVHWSWVACKINYWHCPLHNPILKVCSLFQFFKMSSYIKICFCCYFRKQFFFLSTCWNTLAWMHVVWIGNWNHRKLWMEVIIIEIHLGTLTSSL